MSDDYPESAGEIQEPPEREFLIVQPKVFITYFLLFIMVVIYAVLTFLRQSKPESDVILQAGIKDNPLIWKGQYWRLIASVFLHTELWHLFFNGYALYILGTITEKLYGSARFLLVFLASGITGSLASTLFNPYQGSLGASGAIFGLFGALLYFGRVKPYIFKQTFGKNLYMVLGVNLVIGVVFHDFIDNYAHLGGLCGGFLTAAAAGLLGEKYRGFDLKWAIITITILGLLALRALTPPSNHWDDYFLSGRKALDAGDYLKAARYFKKAAELEPRNKPARLFAQRSDAVYHFETGNRLFEKGEFMRAISHYKQALEGFPSSEHVLYNLAVSYYRMGDIKKAREYHARMEKISPRHKLTRQLNNILK